MSESFNLEAYLNRIQYGGDVRPTLETLSAVTMAHTGNIPFENLDVVLGRPIKLDIESLQNKLVRDKRGGYCFEHGTLMAAALRVMGFEPVSHTARVTLFFPRSQAPRTHMILSVTLAEGMFVLDPGFGGLAPRFPVPAPIGSEPQPSDDRSHWLERDDRFFDLRILTGDKTIDAWSTTFEPENEIDFVLGNHYTSSHPDSPMCNRIMLRAYSGDSMVTAMNRDVTVRRAGEARTFQLADRAALRELLNDHFGFDLPAVEQIRVPSIPEWQ
jgi:N-hydroxyarylamine O-acetyltransferase